LKIFTLNLTFQPDEIQFHMCIHTYEIQPDEFNLTKKIQPDEIHLVDLTKISANT